MLAKLKGVNGPDLSVTAGNASGVNDGAVALRLAGEEAAARNGLALRARVVAMASAGVPPRIMGVGPVEASRKLLRRTGFEIADMDVIELNEAFATQAPLPSSLRENHNAAKAAPLQAGRLKIPETGFAHQGGKTGLRHTEHLGHILTEMHWLQRGYPGATR